MKTFWWNKSRRAQSDTDFETWVEGGVAPTMNSFDNGDSRATTIIFYGNRVADIRLQDDKINTLQSRMGTGGNNMPMMAEVLAFDTFNQTVSDKNQTIKSHSANNENIGTVLEKSTVRRLTPKECERLQGFPDDWTVSQSDSARYKQMGNAVAVPVVDWLIKGFIN